MASTSKVRFWWSSSNQVTRERFAWTKWCRSARSTFIGEVASSALHRSGRLALDRESAFLMMRISDNSATDMVLDRVGIENVNRRLASLGVTELVINRNIQQLLMDQMGFQDWDVDGLTYEELEQRLNDYQVEPGELEMAATQFEMDAQDTATRRP